MFLGAMHIQNKLLPGAFIDTATAGWIRRHTGRVQAHLGGGDGGGGLGGGDGGGGLGGGSGGGGLGGGDGGGGLHQGTRHSSVIPAKAALP